MVAINKIPGDVAASTEERNPNHKEYNTPTPKKQALMRPAPLTFGRPVYTARELEYMKYMTNRPYIADRRDNE